MIRASELCPYEAILWKLRLQPVQPPAAGHENRSAQDVVPGTRGCDAGQFGFRFFFCRFVAERIRFDERFRRFLPDCFRRLFGMLPVAKWLRLQKSALEKMNCSAEGIVDP